MALINAQAQAWDAYAALEILPRGSYSSICMGTTLKNTRCRWDIPQEDVMSIRRILDEMERSSPINAIPQLHQLARLSLCYERHKDMNWQAVDVINRWEATIRALAQNTQHNEWEDQIDQLREQLATAKRERDEANAKAVDLFASKSTIQSLESTLSRLQLECAGYKKTLVERIAVIAQGKEELENAQLELRQQRAISKQQTIGLSQAQGRLKEAALEEETAREIRKNQDIKIEDLLNTQKNLESTVQEKDAALATSEDLIKQFTKTQETLDMESQNKQKELESMKSQLKRLEIAYGNETTENKKHTDTQQNLKSAMQKQQTALDTANSEIEQLQKDFKSEKAKRKNLYNSIKDSLDRAKHSSKWRMAMNDQNVEVESDYDETESLEILKSQKLIHDLNDELSKPLRRVVARKMSRLVLCSS